MRYLPNPPNGASWPVLPDPATGHGTICGTAAFDDAQLHVWAAAYPAIFAPVSPPPTFLRPTWAVLGTSSAGGTFWTWNHTNPIPMAAHSTAGAPNALLIWRQRPNSTVIRLDGSTTFKGVTNTTPCGSGSGSDGGPIDPELACAPVIQVEIPDGCNAGRYPALRTASRAWEVTIGGAKYSIAVGADRTLVLQSGFKAHTSKAVSATPFLATFCGTPFGSKGDVLVMIV